MKQLQRSEDDLKRASAHLHYELWMLTSTANALGSGIAERGWLLNALLESFVIHMRAMSDFFYAERRKPDDVLAADFFPAEDWLRIRPTETDILKNARKRAHKEIVHLTYERLNVTPEAKAWSFLDIARDVHTVMGVFLRHVPKELLSHEGSASQGGGAS